VGKDWVNGKNLTCQRKKGNAEKHSRKILSEWERFQKEDDDPMEERVTKLVLGRGRVKKTGDSNRHAGERGPHTELRVGDEEFQNGGG